MVLFSEGNCNDPLVQPLAYHKQFLTQSPHLALELELVYFIFINKSNPGRRALLKNKIFFSLSLAGRS